MSDVIADKHYWFDAEGNVTTDETKAVRWLAREGANVLPEHRDALTAFQGSSPKAEEVKAESPKANKSAKPTKNKGVKK